MTQEQYNTAESLMRRIAYLKECRGYLAPTRPNEHPWLKFKLSMPRNRHGTVLRRADTAMLTMDNGWGYMKTDNPIAVDREFIEYCQAYYDRKIEETEKEFSQFMIEGNNPFAHAVDHITVNKMEKP